MTKKKSKAKRKPLPISPLPKTSPEKSWLVELINKHQKATLGVIAVILIALGLLATL